jgi:nucleosome assembly protein 1-like 1
MADTGATNAASAEKDAILAALAEAVQKKLNIYSELLKTLPPSVQNRLKALKHLHDGYAKLESQLKEEIRALEKKYQAQYDVIFAQRSDIVKGAREPTPEELAPETPAPAEDKPAKGIPGFWLKVLKNCQPFADTITPADEEALQHLEEVAVRDLDKEEGFIIDFTFSENAFFTNTKLSKTYHLIDDGYEGLTLDRIEGAKIEWKAGKDLSFRLVKKKQSKGGKKGGARQTRVVTVKEPAETFFNFFSPPDLESEEIDDEDDEVALENKLEDDFDLGCMLKDRVIPHAVLWYTGEESLDEDYNFGEDEDEDEDGPGGDDDDEDEDEDEDDAPPPPRGGKGGRGGRGGGRGGAAGGRGLGAALPGGKDAPPQDCKQQ